MSETKPCPWCQREPHVSDCGMPENKDGLYAWCLTDGCANQQKVYKLTAWNRRAAPEPTESDMERAGRIMASIRTSASEWKSRGEELLAAEFAAVRARARAAGKEIKPVAWETEKITGEKKFRHVLTFENDDPCFGVDFAERVSRRAAPETEQGDRERAERWFDRNSGLEATSDLWVAVKSDQSLANLAAEFAAVRAEERERCIAARIRKEEP